MKRILLVFMLLIGFTSALAHADLLESEPAAGAVLDAAPEHIVLRFTEPVETMFSVFKIYALDADVDMSADNAQQRLGGLAGTLVNDVLELGEDDEARVDQGSDPVTGTASELRLLLPEELGAGHYVVMWRVLSVDTHVTQGFFVFTVAAE